MTLSIVTTRFHTKEMMQVQPSDNLLNAHLAKSSQETLHRKVTPTDSVLGGLSDHVAGFIRTVIGMDHTDSGAVERAQNALKDGTLDTFEIYSAVAVNLLKHGL